MMFDVLRKCPAGDGNVSRSAHGTGSFDSLLAVGKRKNPTSQSLNRLRLSRQGMY
jgi:hypothetical protein